MNERIELGHAELLAGLDGTRQESVLTGVIEHKIPVGALKQQLGQFARKLADAIFDTAVCVACPHNSAQQAALFDAAIGDGYCQNPAHYDELTLAEIDKKAAPLREQYQVVRMRYARRKLRVAQDQAADPSNESGDKVQQPQADEPVDAAP